jgi:hypothetical protein
MRKLVSAAIAGLMLSGVLLTGGSPATAAPATAAPATAAPAASVATQTAQQTPGGQHVYIDWYWSLSGCDAAGDRLMDVGAIYGYSCELSAYLTFYLYVDYD